MQKAKNKIKKDMKIYFSFHFGNSLEIYTK